MQKLEDSATNILKDITLGDVVELNSGGPGMTVIGVESNPNRGNIYECMWMVQGKSQISYIPGLALRISRPGASRDIGQLELMEQVRELSQVMTILESNHLYQMTPLDIIPELLKMPAWGKCLKGQSVRLAAASVGRFMSKLDIPRRKTHGRILYQTQHIKDAITIYLNDNKN